MIGRIKGDLYDIRRLENNKEDVDCILEDNCTNYSKWYYHDLQKIKKDCKNNVFFIYDFMLDEKYRTPEMIKAIYNKLDKLLQYLYFIKINWVVTLGSATYSSIYKKLVLNEDDEDLNIKEFNEERKNKIISIYTQADLTHFDTGYLDDDIDEYTEWNSFTWHFFYKRY